jgi:putative hydrolase of the HAD superfamily
MQLSGVLFDLDDTLLDHSTAVAAALDRWLPALGVRVTPEIHALWAEIQEPHLAAWRERRISFAEQRRRRLRDFLPAVRVEHPDDDDELDRIFGGFLRAYESASRTFPDVAGALTVLADAGLATAVLTNGSTEQQNGKIARVGLTGRLGPVFTVDDLGVAKPDPAAFRLACERWGRAPGEVLSIGDRYDLDVLPARAAGLSAAHLDRHGRGPLDEPHRLTSLAELPAFLRGTVRAIPD